MRRMKKNSLAQKILVYLGETCGNLLDLGYKLIFEPHRFIRQHGLALYRDYRITFDEFSKGFYELKKNKYIQKEGKLCYVTPKGRAEIIRTVIRSKPRKEKWDGKWRAIVFDIPEMSRRDRAFLRRELRWIGFTELQKSVWIFPYDIEKELAALIKLWGKDFKGDIRFMKVETLKEDKDLRKLFGLRMEA